MTLFENRRFGPDGIFGFPAFRHSGASDRSGRAFQRFGPAWSGFRRLGPVWSGFRRFGTDRVQAPFPLSRALSQPCSFRLPWAVKAV